MFPPVVDMPTNIDRAMLLTRLKKVTSRHAESTELAIEQSLARIPKAFIKTVTVDNDKDFANHQSLAKRLDADVYFTRPIPPGVMGLLKTELAWSGSSFQRALS